MATCQSCGRPKEATRPGSLLCRACDRPSTVPERLSRLEDRVELLIRLVRQLVGTSPATEELTTDDAYFLPGSGWIPRAGVR